MKEDVTEEEEEEEEEEMYTNQMMRTNAHGSGLLEDLSS